VSKFLFPAPKPHYDEETFPDRLLWVPLALQGGGVIPHGSEPSGGCAVSCQASISQGSGVSGADDYAFPCLFYPNGKARYLVIYFHRNAEDLGNCARFAENLRDCLQVHVLAVEYPGYGPRPACAPSAGQATRHAFAAYAFARDVLCWPRDGIILLGCSVGCGLVLALAAKEEVAGVVLVAPFLSVREACKDRFGGVIASLITEQLPNDTMAPRVQSPTMVVHGPKDSVIPFHHGESLFKMLACRKTFITPTDLGHNTCLLRDEWFLVRPMMDFFGLPKFVSTTIRVPSWAFRQYEDLPIFVSTDAPSPGPVHKSESEPLKSLRLLDSSSPLNSPRNSSTTFCLMSLPSTPVCFVKQLCDNSDNRQWWTGGPRATEGNWIVQLEQLDKEHTSGSAWDEELEPDCEECNPEYPRNERGLRVPISRIKTVRLFDLDDVSECGGDALPPSIGQKQAAEGSQKQEASLLVAL